MQPWNPYISYKTQHMTTVFACPPESLYVFSSQLVYAFHVATFYSNFWICHQLMHLLMCLCTECSCLIHLHLYNVGLEHSRCSGNYIQICINGHICNDSMKTQKSIGKDVLVPDQCSMSHWPHLAVT